MKSIFKLCIFCVMLITSHTITAQETDTLTIDLTATIAAESPACTVEVPSSIDLGELTGGYNGSPDEAQFIFYGYHTCESNADFSITLSDSVETECGGVAGCVGVLSSATTSTPMLIFHDMPSEAIVDSSENSLTFFKKVTGIENANPGDYSGSLELLVSYN